MIFPKNTLQDIGARLREARGNLTQREVAEKIGVAPTSITAYETGKTMPRPPVLRSLSDVLQVSELWLRTGEGPKQKTRMDPAVSEPSGHYGVSSVHPELSPGAVNRLSLDWVYVPVLEGESAWTESSETVAPPVGYLPLPAFLLPNPSASVAFRVQDGAMAPQILPGDTAVVDRAWRNPLELLGRAVAIRGPNGVCLRRLTMTHPSYLLECDNQDRGEAPMSLSLEGGNPILGGVLWVSRAPNTPIVNRVKQAPSS